MPTVEIKEKCPYCDGTGLYVGLGERDGAAVVCKGCCGSGCRVTEHKYEEFTERVPRKGVRRVYLTNPGIFIGESEQVCLEDFGGLPVEQWYAGAKFHPGTEIRKYTCPLWWYQSADHTKKPSWQECLRGFGGPFKDCPMFSCKEQCWKRWDKEFNNSGGE